MPEQHLLVRSVDGPTYYVIGDIITVKLAPQDTTDAYLVVEIVSQPGGGPAFLHTHQPQETFYILEGVFEIYGQDAGGKKYSLRANVGDTVHVPGNAPHGFKNVSEQAGRMLVMYEPADIMLRFFQEVGIPMPDRTTVPDASQHLSMDRILEIFRKYMGLIEVPA